MKISIKETGDRNSRKTLSAETSCVKIRDTEVKNFNIHGDKKYLCAPDDYNT
jgi:hypothetical protein